MTLGTRINSEYINLLTSFPPRPITKDLVPIFKSESTVSEVLSGKRKLTAHQIRKLADFFQMSPADFFESTVFN